MEAIICIFFDTKFKTELMKIALTIMQDENYKIINLDNELGIITAVKQSKKQKSDMLLLKKN